MSDGTRSTGEHACCEPGPRAGDAFDLAILGGGSAAFAELIREKTELVVELRQAALWRAWIDRRRARAEAASAPPTPIALAKLRQKLGLTQVEVARRMGISQSDLSKLERRRDVRLSTLNAYAEALGGRVRLLFAAGTELAEVRFDETRRRRRRVRTAQPRASAARGRAGRVPVPPTR